MHRHTRLARTAARGGFTLIEILIVVIILGILAAIVIPQFSGASTEARKSNVKSTVQTLRSQVALYKLQHGDVLPDLTANSGANWTLLTATSTFNGATVGPYMQNVPVNALNNSSKVLNGTGAAAAGSACGFVYDYNAGAGSGSVWATDTDGVTIVPQ